MPGSCLALRMPVCSRKTSYESRSLDSAVCPDPERDTNHVLQLHCEPQLGARQTEASAAMLELQRLAADMNATVQARAAVASLR